MALGSGKCTSTAKLYLRQTTSAFKVIYRLLVVISNPLLIVNSNLLSITSIFTELNPTNLSPSTYYISSLKVLNSHRGIVSSLPASQSRDLVPRFKKLAGVFTDDSSRISLRRRCRLRNWRRRILHLYGTPLANKHSKAWRRLQRCCQHVEARFDRRKGLFKYRYYGFSRIRHSTVPIVVWVEEVWLVFILLFY